MTSHAPSKCCTVGVKHEGETVGEIKNIGDTPTYFSFPENKSTDKAVLLLTDVMGYTAPNAQLIADQFAANGYFTVMPDLFHGDPVLLNPPEGFQFMEWLKGHLPPRVDPVITAVIKEMRNTYSVKKIGAVGYCFGGKYVARYLGATGLENSASVDAGYTAHPSFVSPEELRAINGPLSIAAAETDQIFPEEKRHETEAILKEMSTGEGKLAYQINLYSGVVHGFAVRGDIKDERARYAKEQAFLQAVQWFDQWLK